jgi:hypothetical protein
MTFSGDNQAATYAAVMKYIEARLKSNAVLVKDRGAPDYLYHKGWGDALRLVRDYATAVDETRSRLSPDSPQ